MRAARTFLHSFFQGFTFGGLSAPTTIPGMPSRVFNEEPEHSLVINLAAMGIMTPVARMNAIELEELRRRVDELIQAKYVRIGAKGSEGFVREIIREERCNVPDWMDQEHIQVG